MLALGGPRAAEFEELLAEQDLVVVATPSGTDPALRRLALSGLAAGRARAPATYLQRSSAARRRRQASGCCRQHGGRSPTPSRRCHERPRVAPSSRASSGGRESGQATILLLGVVMARAAGCAGPRCGRAWRRRAERRAASRRSRRARGRARDARRLRGGCSSPRCSDGARTRSHLERAAYVALGRRAAMITARRNGARDVEVSFPDGDTFAPVRIRVDVRDADRRAARGRAGRCRRSGRSGAGAAVGHRVRDRRRRVPRAAGDAARQADAPRRGRGVRPDGGCRAQGRHLAHRRQRLSLQRRAGGALRAPPGPEMGRAARQVIASARHRARPRPGRRLRLACRERRRGFTSFSDIRGSPGTTDSR